MAAKDYTMLDGSVVSIDGADVKSAWFGRIDWFPRNDGLVAIGSGVKGGLENEPNTGWRIVQEATFQGGRVFAAESGPNYDEPQTILVYQLGEHELYARAVGHTVVIDPWIRTLKNFTIEHESSSIALQVKHSSLGQLKLSKANVFVDDLATVELITTPNIREALPRASGKIVRGGELWKVAEPGGSVILASETTVTRISPLDGQVDAAFTQLAENISVRRNER